MPSWYSKMYNLIAFPVTATEREKKKSKKEGFLGHSVAP